MKILTINEWYTLHVDACKYRDIHAVTGHINVHEEKLIGSRMKIKIKFSTSHVCLVSKSTRSNSNTCYCALLTVHCFT